ncbi:major facilitator superfamily domain-containing protein [Mycena olivaceomarginata]|nr:major facilitator superfamily domain-containing protein [Mycena olivaceomarginata]
MVRIWDPKIAQDCSRGTVLRCSIPSPVTVVARAQQRDRRAPPAATLEEEDFPHGFKLVVLMVALCLGVFPVAIDNTIISTGSTDQFQSLDDAIAATQLLFGKFYTFLPIKSGRATKKSFGSLVCGVAPNSKALIIGRAIAGLGSAGIFTGALVILATHSVPLAERPMSTGLTGAMYGIASVAGPLKGGAFTDKVSWRWGTLVFIPAIVSLLLALQWGGSKYEWENGRIIALFVIFSVFIAAFVVIQIWQQDNTTVPPRIFLKRSIWAGAWFSLTLGASFFIFVFYLPIWFQAIKDTSAVKSGIDNLPMLLSLGTFTGHAHWIGYQVIYGIGMGCGRRPRSPPRLSSNSRMFPSAPVFKRFSQTLVCSSFSVLLPANAFLQSGALFVSVGQNVFQNKLISGLVARVPSVNPKIIFLAGATNLKNAVDPKFITEVISAGDGFPILAMEWKSVKGKKIEMGMA